MLANIHVYILTAVAIFFLLINLWQISDVAFLLPISIEGLEKSNCFSEPSYTSIFSA